MCLYPTYLPNPKYKPNKKNGGIIPHCPDERLKLIQADCRNCRECMNSQASEYNIKLKEELRHNKTKAHFITGTFSPEALAKLSKRKELQALEGYNRENELVKIAIRLFTDRYKKKYKHRPRHWLITELGHGATEHIHFHGILWSNEPKAEIEKLWGYGFMDFGKYVSEQSVNYITKYVTKQDFQHKCYKPKVMTSKNIGAGYLERSDAQRNKFNPNGETNTTYTDRSGRKRSLPLSWRNKLYTDREKELIRIEKENKNERWVWGERVDISTEKGVKEYEKLQQWYRMKNARLGYGSKEQNWEQKMYEHNRRNEMYWKKINMAKIENKPVKEIKLTYKQRVEEILNELEEINWE